MTAGTRNFKFALLALSLTCSPTAFADITVGISLSATGSAAVLGAPAKNTVEIYPATIDGEKINWIALDDASDTTNAVKNANKLITENKVDILIGGSITPAALALAGIAAEAKVPLIAQAPNPADGDKRHWSFIMAQNFSLMAEGILEHMKANNYKTLGFIGFADGYGETWIKALDSVKDKYGVTVGPIERFQRTDTSVTGQAVKLIAAKPDAILVVASGAPAVMPHATLVERGYKGQIYQTHGAPSPAFLKLGGKNIEGGVMVAGPLLVYEQLPDSHPSKKIGKEYATLYEAKFGPGSLSSFGGHMWDALQILSRAIPVAKKKAKSGTAEFRVALRDAIESSKEIVGVHGVFNMSAADHYGHDRRARVLLQVQNGAFKVISN